MSFKQLADEINRCEEPRIDFHSVRFEFREDGEDSIYVSREPAGSGITRVVHGVDGIEAKSSVVFYGCQFDDRFLDFSFCQFINFEFAECDLPYNLRFNQCRFEGNLSFINCDFEQQSLEINSTLFRRGITIGLGSVFEKVSMNHNTFDRNPLPYTQLFKRYHDFWASGSELAVPVYIYKSQIGGLSVEQTDLTDPAVDSIFSLLISDSNFDDFRLNRSGFNSVVLQNSVIRNRVIFDSIEFVRHIVLVNVDFPPVNTNILWKYLKGNKLSIIVDGKIYKAQSDEQLENSFAYNDLISTYENLHRIYKTRGDMESANGCYVEMKDLETARLEHVHALDPAIYPWLNWKLNQFLALFCDYGTNPIKALFISLWAILGFAMFYFFFYDDWDRINRSFLIRQHRKIIEYLRSEKRLEEFHSERYEDHVKTYREYRAETEKSRIEIPFFIRILGKPLFQLSLFRYHILGWLYRRSEILNGKWIDLKPLRKVSVGLIIGLAIFFYLIYLGILRGLNSIILSLNTFTTLGFGDLPMKRFMKYMAILEGFLGWFLLTIFSVSLISQILQS